MSHRDVFSQKWRELWDLSLVNSRRGASLAAQRLKHLTPMWETRVRSLGQEEPLEKETATHSSIRAWRIPWPEELGRLQSTGLQRVGHDWATSLHFTSRRRSVSNVQFASSFWTSVNTHWRLWAWRSRAWETPSHRHLCLSTSSCFYCLG